jgi:peptidoglycan/xylan/chitin deacetylase (PgdA/CDA1 family)
MRLASPFLKRVLYPCLAGTGYLRRHLRTGQLCTITYHGVLPQGYGAIDNALDGALVNAESFRRQLRLLKSRYSVIRPEQLLQWCERGGSLPSRSVLLTCDDGLLNNLTDMLPILQEEELSCLFFVTGASFADHPAMLWYEELYLMLLTARDPHLMALLDPGLAAAKDGADLDRRSFWHRVVKRLSEEDQASRNAFLKTARIELGLPQDWNKNFLNSSVTRQRFLTLTADQLKQLAASGMMIGSHTLTHPILSHTRAEAAWREISESRVALERVLDAPVAALAYPFGDPASVTVREIEMADRAGYSCAFLNFDGNFGSESSAYALPRVHITQDMSLPEFEAHVSGLHHALQNRFAGIRSFAASSAGG